MSFPTRFTREYAGGSIGGILRKGGGASSGASCGGGGGGGGGTTTTAATTTGHASTTTASGEARHIDLLVFGYACKVFRDDAKARDIDQGKHLIPWMNDSTLKIDRYDVRGALYELGPHEPPPGGYGNRLDYLSAEEQRAEQLCEEERYLYLYTNEEDHILQQEEDLKRLKQESDGGGYSQVAFQYGNEANSGTGAGAGAGTGVLHGPNREEFSNSPTCEEPEQAYVLPRNFEVPPFIQLPETMKQHAIIEKTARFIASQGIQMEILLKAKQSNNLQFEFLTQNSTLNPYYKHVMNAMKDGKYPKELDSAKDTADSDEGKLTEKNSHFFYGMNNVPPKPVIAVPTIKYKPSADCAYTQLISKIKGVPLPSVLDEENASVSPTPVANSPAAVAAAAAATGTNDNFTPVLLQYNSNTFVTAEAEDGSNASNGNCSTAANSLTNSNSQDSSPQVELLKNSSALALAQNYSSGSESEDEEAPKEAQEAEEAPAKPDVKLNFPIPPESLQSIIDKTATYVIKNGRQFEETLRTKSEERFTFLIPENEYYPYYMYKITNDPDAASKEQKTRKAAAVAAALLSKKGLLPDTTVSPVSFSIKPKDEMSASTLPPALPQEASDDEEDSDSNSQPRNSSSEGAASGRTVPEHVQKAIKLVESQLMARNAQLAAVVLPPVLASLSATMATQSSTKTASASRSRFDVDYMGGTNAKVHISKSAKSEMERNALYEQQQQNRQKEIKKAEERVKDKLAQIAREKLGGLITKEKQLQLERKRKAMAFVNKMKGTSEAEVVAATAAASAATLNTDGDDEGDDDGNLSDGSNISVHSIPITSYGPDEKTDDEEEPIKALPYIPLSVPVARSLEETRATEAPQIINAKTTTVTVSDDDDHDDEDDDDDDVQVINEIRPPQQHAHRSKSKSKKSVSKHKRKRSRSREAHSHKRHRRVGSIESDASSSSSTTTSTSTDDDDRRRLEKRSSKTVSSRAEKSRKSEKSSSTSHRRSSKKKSEKKSRSPSRSSTAVRGKSHRRSRSRSRSRSRTRTRSRSRSRSYHSRRNRHSRHRSRSSSKESVGSIGSQRHRERRRHGKSADKYKRSSRSPTKSASTNKRKEKHRKYDR